MPLPLNVALPVEGAADITGQEAVVLKTYLELKEKRNQRKCYCRFDEGSPGEAYQGRGLYRHHQYIDYLICE